MSTRQALERLTKWRSFFAAWQLGTRPADDPECAALKDHRELTILMRTESTALVGLLIRRGLFTAEEFSAAVGEEAAQLNADYEKRFQGIVSRDDGLAYLLPEARETMRRMNFKP